MKAGIFSLILLVAVSAGYSQGSKYGKTDADSVKCVENLSLYYEFFKQKNYKDALNGWRAACEICPKSRKSLYINGVKMYKKFIADEKDDSTKQLFVDTLLGIYDKRIEHFSQEGFVLGRKGADMMKYRGDNRKAGFDVLKKSFDLQGNKAEAGAILAYYRALYLMERKKEATCQELKELYPKLADAISYNIANQEKKSTIAGYKKVQLNMNKMYVSCASCDDLENLFAPKFKENPTDTILCETIVNFFVVKKCMDKQLFVDASEALFKGQKHPTARSAIRNGKILSRQKKYADAIPYFKQGAELALDDTTKIEGLMNAAKCYYNIGQYASCRTYAQKALAVNPKLGEAYIVIGDAYAKSSKDCGSGNCKSKASYWVAVDKYERAKAVDASVAATANTKIANAKGHFPKNTDCFFETINDGDSYTVGCWINETTIVRTRQ